MKVAFLFLSVACLLCGCATHHADRQQTQEETIQSSSTLEKLPQSLWTLQEHYAYKDWEAVTVFSRTLNHYRQVRFLSGKNLIISETGRSPNLVDVVEVILIPSDLSSEVSFALYDPKTGRMLDRYPDEVVFDVEGIHDGSKAPVPGLCIACHHHEKSLNALLVWDPDLEQTIAKAREAGFGIRQGLVDPIPSNQKTRKAIERMNQRMQDQFPNRFYDVSVNLPDL